MKIMLNSLCVVLLLLCTQITWATEEKIPTGTSPGNKAPFFNETAKDGRAYPGWAGYHKTPTIIYVFDSLSPSWQDNLRDLDTIYTDYIGQAWIISFYPESALDKVADFISANNIEHPVVTIPEQESFKDYIPDKYPAFFIIGSDGIVIQKYLSDIKEPISEIYKLLEFKMPINAEDYVIRGRGCWELENYEEAIGNFEHAIELNPGLPDAHFWIGDLYGSDNDFSDYFKSVEHLDKTIELDPDYLKAYISRTEIEIYKTKDYAKAKEIFEMGKARDEAYFEKSFVKRILDKRIKFEGKPALDFESSTIDGEIISLSQFKNQKPVLLVFWNPGCGACRRELPELQKLYELHSSEIEIIAVCDRNKEKHDDFIGENNFTFKMVFDESGTIVSTYDTSYWPSTFFINKEGIIENLDVRYAELGDMFVKEKEKEVKTRDYVPF
ncbi:redoxin domain-containing protein [bacterium]|nr:redoxin domain-containing protein [bacterium]